MTSIQPNKVTHFNMITTDAKQTVDHFRNVYDAEIITAGGERHRDFDQSLFAFGGVMFEQFVPDLFFLHAKPGPQWYGMEHNCDLSVARKAVAERNIRITRDIAVAFHTNPQDHFGVPYEYYGGEFERNVYATLGNRSMKPVSYWRDEHPSGLAGLKGYTVAVSAHEAIAAVHFYEDFFSANRLYEKDRPEIGARAVGLHVANGFVEILSPLGNGDGPIRRYLEWAGRGMYSLVMGARDIDQLKKFLAGKKITLGPGTAENRWAAPAEANLGMVFEFER